MSAVDEGMREAVARWHDPQAFQRTDDSGFYWQHRRAAAYRWADAAFYPSSPIASALAARERELEEARSEARNYADMAEATGRMMQDRVTELLAENATLRASAERTEADHAEEIARLKEVLAPLANASIGDPGRSGLTIGDVLRAKAALTPKEPNDG